MKYEKYTDEEIATLLTMYEAGIPVRLIADRLGRTREQVSSKIGKMRKKGIKIEHRKIVPVKINAFRREYGVKLGDIRNSILNGAIEPEAFEWMFRKARSEGYDSVAEMLVDYIIDLYVEEDGLKNAARKEDGIPMHKHRARSCRSSMKMRLAASKNVRTRQKGGVKVTLPETPWETEGGKSDG